MNHRDSLLDLWLKITPREGYPFSYQKIDDSCATDLNIGVSSKHEKCIILVLPANFFDQNPLPVFSTPIDYENIQFYLHEEREMVLLLKDDFYFKEFLDFTETLLPEILDSNEYDSPLVFISILKSWFEMFKPSSKKKLSKIEVLGLLAELLVLEIELNSLPLQANLILNGWRGPYGYSKDFEFEDRYIEVKYKAESKKSIHISSEFQLDTKGLKPVHLDVVTGKDDHVSGVTLSDLYKKVRKKIRAVNGDISIYLKTLGQLGIIPSNISSYDDIKVAFIDIQTFDASLLGFPSIQRQYLKDASFDVQYKIDIGHLDEFLLKKECL